MTNFPSPVAPDRPTKPKKPKMGKRGWLIIAAIVLFALLLAAPALGLIVSLLGLIATIIGIFVGKLPFLKSRKKVMVFGAAMAFLSIGAQSALSAQDPMNEAPPAVAEPMVISSESPSPTPTESASPTAIADFVGLECEGDELVMEQGAEKLYCDESSDGILVWANQEDHDKNVLAAKKAAEEKAVKEKAAAEKKKAEAKALAEKKAAEKAAAAKEAAAEKAEREESQKLFDETMRKINEEDAYTEVSNDASIDEAYEAPAPASVSYANCTEARAAGAAPISRGEPGYASHLDRDGDGIGCDS